MGAGEQRARGIQELGRGLVPSVRADGGPASMIRRRARALRELVKSSRLSWSGVVSGGVRAIVPPSRSSWRRDALRIISVTKHGR